MHILSKALIRLFNSKVGQDQFGNTYYQSKSAKRHFNRPQRYVIYKELVEGSKVPQEWFLWLHNRTKEVPQSSAKKHRWQLDSRPNLTGTKDAYYPDGCASSNTKCNNTAHYKAWRPNI